MREPQPGDVITAVSTGPKLREDRDGILRPGLRGVLLRLSAEMWFARWDEIGVARAGTAGDDFRFS